MALFSKKKDDMDSLGGVPPPPGAPQDMNSQPDMGMPPPDMNQVPPDPAMGQQGYYDQQGPDMGTPPPDMNSQQNGQMPPPDMSQDMGGQMLPDTGNYPDQGYPQTTIPEPQFQQSYPADDTKERIEEIAEAIIDEKWNELVRDINKVVEWKERTDNEIKRIAQEILNMKERFESLHKGVLGKITEYDHNLTNVGSEIKAMEMAFQKILPTFTENVNKLDRFVKRPDSNK